jgi:hemerythrin-like metal-binding protein
MTALTWSRALILDHPQMDQTHEEFVALLAAADAALPGPEAALLQAFDTLVDHTIVHFAQEERWMSASGFAPENCHAFQHQAVLQVMRECARRAREASDFEPLRLAVGELAIWFPQHANMMDAALAQHLADVGFDPETGQCAAPLQTADALTGCGSQSCS